MDTEPPEKIAKTDSQAVENSSGLYHHTLFNYPHTMEKNNNRLQSCPDDKPT